ncbi:MAG TPA: type II secretion system protein GspG [Spirochaetia bacterium]|nr:type II secretion system protein GspG [Spirochaetia bacterium]
MKSNSHTAHRFFIRLSRALKEAFCPSTVREREAGLTVIETIIVIAIIAMVATTVAITSFSLLGTSKEAVAKNQIESFRAALEIYHVRYGMYPTREQGLEALRTKPVVEPVPEKWDRAIMDRDIPKDPWGNPYEYLVPGPEGDPWGIVCYGADGVEGGEGDNKDIKSWE